MGKTKKKRANAKIKRAGDAKSLVYVVYLMATPVVVEANMNK